MTLNTNLTKIAEKRPVAGNIIVIIKPFSTLAVVEALPTGDDYLRQLSQLIQNLTQLEPKNFTIEEDRNPVTGESDYQQVFITLPSRDFVDKVYHAQPFFGCLIAHKLTHTQICAFRKYDEDQCLMCSSKKNPPCIQDMCQDCCSRQKYGTLICECSFEIVQKLQVERNKYLQSMAVDVSDLHYDESAMTDSLCEKCLNFQDKGCVNSMCSVCCPIQAIRSKCQLHDESLYSRAMRAL